MTQLEKQKIQQLIDLLKLSQSLEDQEIMQSTIEQVIELLEEMHNKA